MTMIPFSSGFFNLKITMLLIAAISMGLLSCSPVEKTNPYTIQVYQTNQAGDNLKLVDKEDQTNSPAAQEAIELNINPDKKYQEYIGFGASFTESSAWNLATIPVDQRKAVLTKLFSPTDGAGFTLTRTHINSCDYSNNHYTYVNDGDESLASFSIEEDLKGFNGQENEQVKGIVLEDEKYDLIPMILEAKSIPGAKFNIIASSWSPPSWMKTGETSKMTNGTLLPKYYGTWAKYLSKYVTAYQEQGIHLWGITPQNEPLHAHDARWDSNGFTAEQGRDFLRDHLGPQLVKDGHLNLNNLEDGLRVVIYDHNKATMNDYVTPTYEDPKAAQYAWGTGFHWYACSELEANDWFADDLEKLYTTWPNKGMIHTESSIDIDAADPIGQYWRESTDYAGKFVPFDTYAYDIITNLNHGTQGYIEWCIILSNEGKPNPYDNFNSAPVLINPQTDEVIYTPLYYLLSHFSKFIRPGAKRIELQASAKKGIAHTVAINPDGSIALVVFNRNNELQHLEVSIKGNTRKVSIGPRTIQTLVIEFLK